MMTVLPYSMLVRQFLMKLGSVLSPPYFNGTQSGTFQRGDAIFRLLQGYHKTQEADEVCVA